MFTHHHNPEYFTSDVFGPGVVHCFSARGGGVSTGHLASLNLGIHRGDLRENVLKNYDILGKSVGFDKEDLIFTHQTHTSTVVRVDDRNRGQGLVEEVTEERDGLMTDVPGLALTVFSADCTPVLLYDPIHRAVAACHAGWRGTAGGIVKNAVEQMTAAYGTDPGDVRAAIGPCIGRCCFETDRDVPDAMIAALGEPAKAAIDDHGNGKYHVDLKLLNRLWLECAGVTRIDVCDRCTACEPDRFWSHRKVGNARGSLAAIIQMLNA